MEPRSPITDCSSWHAPIAERGAHAHDHRHPAPHTHSVRGVEVHRPRQRQALAWSLGLTLCMLILEVIGGVVTGSLMLLSDAAHMLSHAVALGVSWIAIRLAARPRTSRSHYGLFRVEILASLFNGLGLLVLTAWIGFEAAERLRQGTEILGPQMIAVALLGLAVNLTTAWILARSGAEDLNTKSALMHMLGDLFSSMVIVLGGAVLWATGWNWLDPILSLVVALVILWWGLGLIREACRILLELSPRGVDPDEVARAMQSDVEGIEDVHDLHVWEITSGYVCLTAHVVVEDGRVSETHPLRDALGALLWRRFGIAHSTLQWEAKSGP